MNNRLGYGGLFFTDNSHYYKSNYLDTNNPRELFTEMEDVFSLKDVAIDPNNQTLYLSLVIM